MVLRPYVCFMLGHALAALPASPECRSHSSRSECLAFRNQHNCVWHAPEEACVDDQPCDQRSTLERCHSEHTTGEQAPWDDTKNRCFWDAMVSRCRWTDECLDYFDKDSCTQASCAWKKLCTPADNRRLPGPNQCAEVCTIPADDSLDRPMPKPSVQTPVRQASTKVRADVVSTTSGQVQGIQTASGGQMFLGVPYAQAPVADLRWAPPAEISWSGVLDASGNGPSCTQALGYHALNPDQCHAYTRGKCLGYAEDCLNLNVWTSELDKPKAVMVWIHGGCFVSGSAGDASYNGESLAAEHDVVVVDIQFRLGVFGYLASDSLRPRDPDGSTGNYGLMDNVFALKWIQQNAASFGGNSKSITIFGESSGAGQVSQLLGVPSSWPYFHRGIMESGAGSFWTYMDLEGAAVNFGKVADATGCAAGADQVACLLNASSSTLSSSVGSLAVPCKDGCSWAPVVDGVYVVDETVNLARAGKLKPDVDLISGFNLHDGAMFVPGFPLKLSTMAEQGWNNYFTDRFGANATSRLEKTFPVPQAVEPSILSRYYFSTSECETDYSYACSAQWVSTATAPQGGKKYVYQFSEPTTYGLVLHGDDIGYVFNTIKDPSEAQQQVTSMMMAYWTNFAKTGNPNGEGLPTWPSWDDDATLINISATPSLSSFPGDSFNGCEFFNQYWSTYGTCRLRQEVAAGQPRSVLV